MVGWDRDLMYLPDSSEVKTIIINMLKAFGPSAPRDVELFFRKENRKHSREELQNLIAEGKVKINDNLKCELIEREISHHLTEKDLAEYGLIPKSELEHETLEKIKSHIFKQLSTTTKGSLSWSEGYETALKEIKEIIDEP